MDGYEVKFRIYADSEDEARRAEAAIKGFISQHALNGRAVTGNKIIEATSNWSRNAIVRNAIINFLRK